MPAQGISAAPVAAATERSGAPSALSPLDAALAKQQYALEPLLPTPTNINPVHLPRSNLLHFVALQCWVGSNLGMQLPLLNGMFVLVPSNTQQPVSKILQAACSYSPTESSAIDTAACAAIPWRLRQVSAVEVAPGVDPADATVVLVGGDRVRAGAVREGLLAEMPDHEYLCCEVADLQRRHQLRQLRVCDVAHMAWRLRVACDLDGAVKAFEQELFGLAGSGCDPATMSQARSTGLESARGVLMQLPPKDWVDEQILQYVELKPLVWPESPDQPWTLFSAAELTQLLQDAAAAWQHYVQQRLVDQQPQPVTDLVPWLPVATDPGHLQAPPVAESLQSAGAIPFRARVTTCSPKAEEERRQDGAANIHSLERGRLAEQPCRRSSNSGGRHSDRPAGSILPHNSNRSRSSAQRDRSRSSCDGSHSRGRGRNIRLNRDFSSSLIASSERSRSRSRSRSTGQGQGRSHNMSRDCSFETGEASPPTKPARSRSCSRSLGRDHPYPAKGSSSCQRSSCSRSPGRDQPHPAKGINSRHHRSSHNSRSRSRSPGRDQPPGINSRQHTSSHRSRSHSPGRDHPHPAKGINSYRHHSSHPSHSRSRSPSRDNAHPAKGVNGRQHRGRYPTHSYSPCSSESRGRWGEEPRPLDSRQRGFGRDPVSDVGRSVCSNKYSMVRHRTATQHGVDFLDSKDRVKQLTQEWLQKLAVRLQPVRRAPHTPNCISMCELKLELPLPSLVIQHHGGVMSFVAATPELQWKEPPRTNQMWYLYIVPDWQERLLKEARYAAEIDRRGAGGAADAGGPLAAAARRSTKLGRATRQ